MAIEKNPIHTDKELEEQEQEQAQEKTISPEEHENEIDRQDGLGRDGGYVPEPEPEQRVENEIDHESAGEEQISEKSSSRDMDWER